MSALCPTAINFNSLEEFLTAFQGPREKTCAAKCAPPAKSESFEAAILLLSGQDLQALSGNSGAGPLAFGAHNRLFFEKICEKIQTRVHALFCAGRTRRFQPSRRKTTRMVDKYFCMDYELGRKYNLYVLSWLEISAPAWSEKSLSIMRARARRKPKRIWVPR